MKFDSSNLSEGAEVNRTEVLRRAKELLSDERQWSRAGFAADVNGKRVLTNAPTAVSWCWVGAICHVQDIPQSQLSMHDDPVLQTLVVANGFEYWGDLPKWNDKVATHAELIGAFDRALLLVAEEENVGELVEIG